MAENKLKHLLFEDVFFVIDILMAASGLNKIYQPQNLLTKFRIFQWILFVISILNVSFLLSGIVIFVIISESVFDILESIPNILVSIIALSKIATLICRRKLICELINDLKILWPSSDDINAIKRFHKIVSPTLKLCFFYSSVTIGTAVAFGMIPILSATIDYVRFGEAHMKLEFFCWYPFNYEISTHRFQFVFWSQFWSGFTVANSTCFVDIFLCILISLLCYHFETLGDSLKSIQLIPSNIDDYESIKDANIFLQSCVVYHCRILRLCQLLEDIFSIAMFVNLSMSALTICQLLFNILVVPPDKRFIYILYLISVTVQVFMLCEYSDKLIRQSSRLTSAAYHCEWYKMDKRFRMIIIPLQIRAQKPVALTALKFVILSINAFLHIVGSAWSYFTLLRHIVYGK